MSLKRVCRSSAKAPVNEQIARAVDENERLGSSQAKGENS